jgi:hypothetical protein
MWTRRKTMGENPDVSNNEMSTLKRIKGLRFSFKHFKIGDQSFYSITWEDGA